MRLASLFFIPALLIAVALQSFVGGSPQSEADETIVIAALDICTIEAATEPVLATESREIIMVPAHKTLTVTPATFGTRIETVTVVPEHREGATFLDEPKRVIISEPTRRLRAIDAVFRAVPAFESRDMTRFKVTEGELIENTETLPPLPDDNVVVSEARIQAVRINAGLRMLDAQVIDRDGDGAIVAAETVEITVRTVETQPKVDTGEVAAITETVQVQIVATPSRRIDAEAVCTIAERPDLIRSVQAALTERGLETGEPGQWDVDTIDSMAAAQAEETGLVSPALLLETLRAWIPEPALPVS